MTRQARTPATSDGHARTGAIAIALLLLIPWLLFAKTLRPGAVLATSGTEQMLPWSTTASEAERALAQVNVDGVRENLVYRIVMHRAAERGETPWWSPEWFGGLPFVASSHTQALYPASLLAALLDPFTSYGTLVAFHLSVAAAGAWLWLRGAGLGVAASALGALVFMLNGMFVTRHGHPQFVASGAWLPWILAGVEALGAARFARGALLVAGGSAATILAGHPSVYVYGFYFIAAWALIRLLVLTPEPRDPRAGFAGLAVLAGCVALGAGLASVQLFAVLELRAFSERAVSSQTAALSQLPDAVHLWRAVFPDATGSVLDGSYWSPSPTSYTAGSLYVGIVPLILAVIGATNAGRRGAALGGLCIGVLLLIYVPALAALAHAVLPGFEFSRLDRLSIGWFVALPMLAALGLEALARGGRTRGASPLAWGLILGALAALALMLLPSLARDQSPRPELAIEQLQHSVMWSLALAAIGMAGLAWARRSPGDGLAPLLLIGITTIDLTAHAWPFVIVRDAERMFRETPLIRFLRAQPQPFRIAKYAPDGGAFLFPANTPAVFGIEDLHGFGPLHIRDLDVMLRAVEARPVTPRNLRPFLTTGALDSRVLDLLQVRYVLSETPILGTRLELVYEGELFVYENRDALPRATFARHWRVEPNAATAAQLIHDGVVDPADTVILEREPPGLVLPSKAASGAEVHWVSRTGSRVTLRKSGEAAGLVRLADLAYPGWEASIDGQAVPVLRAEGALRAVVVPAGEHTVEFHYRPSWRSEASTISAFAAVVFAGVLLLAARSSARFERPSASIDS